MAVVDQAVAVQGTNLVLSWPSKGFEYYMIQYRPTLDPSTPWQQLTNTVPANSTNRTTYVLPCCALVDLAGTNLTMFSQSGAEEESFETMAELQSQPQLWVLQENPDFLLPLAMYPPGFNTNGFNLIEASALEVAEYNQEQLGEESELSGGGVAAGISNGGCDCPSMGFFRVWHIPDWNFDITNYTYDGSWFLPIDFKDYRDRVDNVQVLINGEVSPYAEFMTYGSETNWGIGFDFDRLTNGNYQIQLVSTVRLNDNTDESAAFLVLSNLTRTVTVFNEVEFSGWDEFIQDDTYTFKAHLLNTNADWSIDIYDALGNYVNTGTGHTSDGEVAWTWNLLDWQGNSRDDFDSDPFFYGYITFDSVAGTNLSLLTAQETKPTPPVVKGYPDRGEWIISFQDRWYSDGWGYPTDLQTEYEDAVSAIFGGPSLVGDTVWWFPLDFGTNYTYAQREQSWTNLLSWMGDLKIRNFYYHGHGGSTSIGCDKHTFSTNGLVTGGVFSFPGSRSQIQNWQIAGKTKYKRFRFVYLDGCSTASGDLPNAFNISKTLHDLSFYQNHPKHPRPSVFVGWNQTVGGDGWGSAYKRLDFQSYWMGNWANDFDHPDIETALDRANTGAGWVTHAKLWGALTIYGYKQMRMEDYNSKGDWQYP